MKKRTKIAIAVVVGVIVCTLAALLVWQLTACGTVQADGETVHLSLEETQAFRRVLKRDSEQSAGGGFGRFTSYGCGFSEDFSIRIGGLTYCFGQDDCPSVYIEELDFYYCTSKENHEALHKLLAEVE